MATLDDYVDSLSRLMEDSHHILVDEVEDHVCQARVTPVAVNQQQLTEVFEPGDGKVTGHDGLMDNRQRQSSVHYSKPPTVGESHSPV